jgi:pseudolysin
MKTRSVNRLLKGFVLAACLPTLTLSYAAHQEVLWGKIDNYTALLQRFTLVQGSSILQDLSLPVNLNKQQKTIHALHYVSGNVDQSKKSHVRYSQYYKGLPVWGIQVIYHVSPGNTTITGSLLNGIENDLTDLNGNISSEQAKQIAFEHHSPNKVHIEKIIYFDKDISTKAILAYHVSYLLSMEQGPEILSYIIDANTGKIINKWNTLHKIEVGQGPGGVNVEGRLPYRPGKFQYGSLLPNTDYLGMNEISYNAGRCRISNNLFRVINLQNRTERQLAFELPASFQDERVYRIKPFDYSCSAPNYANMNDDGYAPVNDGLSPVNDVTYFIQQTFNMLTNEYQVSTPVGNQLPIRVYTHLANYDNAFACGPSCMIESGIDGPQQLVFGNGAREFSPITDGDGVAHEFGHLVTEHFSDLVYENQPGGLNESFSDMTGMAMLYYQVTIGYRWYWDEKDWTTGASVSKTGKPLRYLDNPPLDGSSIDNARQFRRGMDPHLSSGVFNKAFYLLSTFPGWTVSKAYRVMLDANMYYWTKRSNFQTAACGVVQAARDRAYPEQDVRTIFQQVGVNNWTLCNLL